MADREVTLDDIQAIEDASPEVTLESLPVVKAPTQAAPTDPNQPGFVSDVVHQDFVSYGVARLAAEQGMEFDPNFDLGTNVPKKEWDEATAGLTDTAKENIAEQAKSRSHMYFLIDLANESQKADERLAAHGGWGIAGRMAVDIFDPVNFLSGVGVATKAERLMKAGKAAQTLAEVRAVAAETDAAVKAGHAATVARTAATAVAENVTLQAITDSADPNRDGWDLAYAGIGASVVGGTLGRVLSGSEKRQLRKLHGLVTEQLTTLELKDAIATTRNTLTSALGDVNATRAQLGDAVTKTASFLGGRDTDLSDYGAFRRALESNGKADAANPLSSAVGIDQFTEGTWLGMVAQQKPKWAEGLSKDELLALRKDPAKSGEMVAALDKANETALRKAGAPVNHFTLYAAHHFGPNKGVRFAKASAETLMDDILTEGQLKANPYLRGLTKEQAMANWAGRARKAGIDLGGMLDRVPTNGVEAQRTAQLAAFDKGDAKARLTALDEQLKAHEENVAALSKDAEGVLPQGQARKLQREVDDLQKELRGHKGTLTAKLSGEVKRLESEIADLTAKRPGRLAALKAEDELKLGADIANNKQRTKLREAHMDGVDAVSRKNLERLLTHAKDAHARRRFSLKERLQQIQPQHEAHLKASKARDALAVLKGDTTPARLTEEGSKLREALGLHDKLEATHAADLAKRADLKDLHRALKPKADTLDKLDSLDGVESAATLREAQLAETGTASAFGADTLSAARNLGFDEGLFPHLENTSSGTVGKMKLAGATNLWGKGTFAGVLRGSENDVVRNELGVLVGNSLGNKGNGAVELGASEVASHFQKTQTGKFHAAVTPAYDAWMKEQGINRLRQWNRNVRGAFMRELGLHIRGNESESAAIAAAAGRIRAVFKEFLDEAKAAGVKGFENVEANENYLPRVFDFHAFHAHKERFGPDQLATLVQKGIQQIYEELDDTTANKIATAYIKRMRELRVGNDAGLMQGMSFDDVGFLRQFLGDAKLGSDEVEEIVGKFAAAKRPGGASVMNQEGNFRHAKMRQKFDENFSMELYDVKANDGTRVPVYISDLFDNNIESLFGRYSRTMSGHIGLAKVGIKSYADFKTRLDRVARALENDPDQQKAVHKMATAAYDIIAARPLEDANVWSELMRTGRDLSYATQMENAGLANIPDMASLLAWGNFKYTAKSFFSGEVFGAMWSRGTDGRLANELMREIEETTGIGTDFLNNAIHSSYDVSEDYAQAMVGGHWFPEKVSRGFSKLSHGARVTSRGVTAGSGMAAVNSLGQRMAARNIIYRLKDDVFKGGKFSDARSAALGLDVAMKKRIEKQMRTHTEWTKGDLGGDIQRVNFDKWDDLDARDAFLYAVHREARKNIQEEDLGDTFYFQHRGIGKVLTQFRRFGITAWTKQTLRGIADHDAETATRVALQFTLAAGVYQAKHELVVAGMEAAGTDPDKIQKYKDTHLTPGKMVAAGVRNSGWAALMPDVYDSTVGYAFGTPLFSDVRNSGNSTTLWSLNSIPVSTLGSSIGTAAAGTWQALVRSDRQFDRHDLKAWQALLPFGNHLLVAPLFEALGANLPEADDDPDPESVGWLK
jgi:hypothetical protein